MRVTREELLYIKHQIEKHIGKDPSLTDVIINYQVKKTEGAKNFLKLDINIL
jgi:hypothetical protein